MKVPRKEGFHDNTLNQMKNNDFEELIIQEFLHKETFWIYNAATV